MAISGRPLIINALRHQVTTRVVDLVVVASGAVLVLAALSRDVAFRVGPIAFRSQGLGRPLLALVIAAAFRLWLARPQTRSRTTALSIVEYATVCALGSMVVAIAATYCYYHVRSCGGLDSYGYVSASSVLASGRLRESQPVAALLPFDGAAAAAAPIGWVVGADGQSRVPRFPLGLPMVMALSRIASPDGPFFVPLVLAFATLAVVYLAAARVSSDAGGVFAAGLLAVNPVFVDWAIQPMSDVPATFWLITAVWLRLIQRRLPVVAGICGGMALLTRPALLPAVGVLAITSVRRTRDTLWFAGTLAVFLIVQVTLNQTLYGAPGASGYGAPADLFQVARLAGNIENYAVWITYSHTMVFWVACVIGLIALRRERWAWEMLAVAAGVVLPYLFYLTFDDWESPRFILPAIALVSIIAAVGTARVVTSAFGRAWNAPVLILLLASATFWSDRFLRQQHVFELSVGEAKYPLVGKRINELTPEGAVVFAALHSGSIRYYGARETVRWDLVPAGALQTSVRRVREVGRPTYLVLDVPGEAEPFRTTFASDLTALDMTLLARVREVEIFELSPDGRK